MEKIKVEIMESQFFFHGNPSNGESTAKNKFDGLEEKVRDEFFKFASNKDMSPYLLCEIRRWKNTLYSIYSYYHDGRDYENRPNGHCVLTLIVKNQYCRHTIDLYHLMVVIYKQGLQKTLNYIDESGRFLISSFYGMEQLDYLGNDFYRNIDESTFINIDNSFQSPIGSEIELFNPSDIDSSCFFDSLQNNGKVIVTENIMSYKQQVISLQSKADKIGTLESKIQTANSEINRLKEENKTLAQKRPYKPISTPEFNRSRVDALAVENNRLKEELTSLKSKITRETTSKKGSLLDQVKKQFQHWFQITTLILLLICVIGVYKKDSKSELIIPAKVVADDSEGTNIESYFTQMKETCDFLKEIATHQMFSDAHKADRQNINIVSPIVSNNAIKAGAEGKGSKVELKDSNLIIGLNPSMGEWVFSGCCTKLESDSVLFGPTDTTKSATIEYKYNGIIVLQRIVKVTP